MPSLKKREREKVIWEHMEKVMNGDLQESKWEHEMKHHLLYEVN